ncbi:MAG TPA: addiction module protein [Gemmata sp.]|jgi:putative addiction module component (TIGR02574 family)|nr:addiction module protein [Gemmata sp.]
MARLIWSENAVHDLDEICMYKEEKMSEVAEKIKSELLALSEEERIEIANFLYETISTQEDDELEAELDRRRAEHESGKDPGIPAEEFFRELRENRP